MQFLHDDFQKMKILIFLLIEEFEIHKSGCYGSIPMTYLTLIDCAGKGMKYEFNSPSLYLNREKKLILFLCLP